MDHKRELKELLLGMRAAFYRGENVMEYARRLLKSERNSVLATTIAYDLQAGSYVKMARENPRSRKLWNCQIAEIIRKFNCEVNSILEVGCGEATTLSGVIKELKYETVDPYGFDISWSRIHKGLEWLKEQDITAHLFVADLFEIPIKDNSIDVVYTSHSLEPNGGMESLAIKELLRIARKTVVLIEPIFELGSEEAKVRMKNHGYVRGLKETAEKIGAKVLEYKLLEYIINPLNPSGVIVLEKIVNTELENANSDNIWQCPLSGMSLEKFPDLYYSKDAGIAYPVVRDIPVILTKNAIVASCLYDV